MAMNRTTTEDVEDVCSRDTKEIQIGNRKIAFSMDMIGLTKKSLEWQPEKGSKNVNDTNLTSLWITTLI